MVQQDVIDYIREGKSRGFSLGVMKNKLLENGFSEQDVDEAIRQIDSGVGEIFTKENKFAVINNKGLPWIKASGWIGAFMVFVFVVLGSLVFILPDVFDIFFSDKIIFLACFIVGIGLFSLHYSGFIKIGKNANEGKLVIGSWLLVVMLFLVLIVSIFGNSVSSLSLQTAFPILAMSLLIVLLVGIVGQFLFAWGLLKISKGIRFAKASGILNMVMCFVFLIFVISSAVLAFSMINAISDIGSRTATFGIENVFNEIGYDSFSVKFFSVMFILTFVLEIAKLIFDVLVLVNGSRRFES